MSDYRYQQKYSDLQLAIDHGFDPSDSYGPLESDSLIKMVGNDTFICLLCNKKLKLMSGNTIDMHQRSIPHQSKFDDLCDELLEQIPKPNSLQMITLSEYLSRLYQQHALQDNIYEVRDLIINQFFVLCQSIDGQITFRVHGSHLTRTSLTHSNINMEIIHPNSKLFRKDPRDKDSIHHKLIDPDAEIGRQFNYHSKEYDLISNPIETLYKIYMNFSLNFKSFFHVYSENPLKDMVRRIPKLSLRHVETGTILDLSCYDDSSYKQSELLKIYTSLDHRVGELACLVKYWANICCIDKPDRGTYPPETYLIMIIYYLQRTSPPILPCVHEMFPNNVFPTSEKNVKHGYDNSVDKLNQLAKGLKDMNINKDSKILDNKIKFYGNSCELNARQQIELQSDTGPTQPTTDQDDEPVEDEPDDDEDVDESLYFHCNLREINELIRNWVPQKEDATVSTLFIEFMKFMKHDLEIYNSAISIRQSARFVTNTCKTTIFRTKMIEDPIKPKLNISRCIGSTRQFDYIVDCFRRAFYYLTSVPLDANLKSDIENKKYPEEFIKLFYNEQRIDAYFYMKWYSDGKLSDLKPSSKDNLKEMINQQLFARDVYVINALFDGANNQQLMVNQIPRSLASAYQKRLLIPTNTDTIKFCWLCKNHGHSRAECFNIRMLTLHNEITNYDPNLDNEADMDEMFWEMYKAETITPKVSGTHEKMTQLIHGIIQTGLPEYDFQLNRFGSTVNNLGSIDSDIDICLTLRGNETGVGVNCVEILRKVSDVLAASNAGVHHLEPVLTARVPIIRFKFRQFDIDLSMYNHCALYNSELLRFYSTVDERVPLLAYLVKKIAKTCCIADASKGSLSSYGWSLLVIHYLQHIEPPILPVLQEPLTNLTTTSVASTGGDDNNKFGVQGWNVWFRKDLGNFERSSTLTVTELFKGFFLYYGCFDWDAYVVSIRKSSYIPRYQKSWNNSIMAIEDPFELTYNLAGRLDDPMSIYIINTLANAYRHIVKAQHNYRDTKTRMSRLNLNAVLFSSIRSINGSNPPWRGCKICHRIGHRIKDCPDRRMKFTNNNGDNQQQQTTAPITPINTVNNNGNSKSPKKYLKYITRPPRAQTPRI